MGQENRPLVPSSTSVDDESVTERHISCQHMNKINKIYKEGAEVYLTNDLRICTDGAPKGVIPDNNWQRTTAYGNHVQKQYLNALKVNYIVLPGDYNGKARLGDRGVLIDESTGNIAHCIVGEVGPNGATFGEVSIAAVWDIGYPNHKSANYGISGTFTVIVYPNSKIDLDWKQPIQRQINGR